MATAGFTIHAFGDWSPGQVRLTRADAPGRRVVPEVERLIDETWSRVASRPGVHLFDGPMCRMESFHATPAELSLTLSPISYKPFVGTNLHNPHLANEHGRDVMANPVGISTLLETADGFLLLGVRNASVAYYPDRVHPFAGSLEPGDGADAFAAAYRELEEEVALVRSDVTDIRCVGLVEDGALLQPELIFVAKTNLSRADVERRIDPTEHDAVCPVSATREGIQAALGNLTFTPVALAAATLWGRLRVGLNSFDDAAG
jgi:8-oxo-dGTP pyrophosphatase MutT (NUDIX family)